MSHFNGGITSGLDISEMAVIPMLINNADVVCLLAVGSGCPTPVLSHRMKWRILEKKLLFIHHVASLPDSALSKDIYKVTDCHKSDILQHIKGYKKLNYEL
jgi:hypothetical protein